jgi:hypothetical protein
MSQLIKYDAACRAIAECKAIDEVKDWRDRAAALQAYARQAKNKQLEVDSAEIRIRAERRLGQMLKETPDSPTGPKIDSYVSTADITPTLADMGISRDLSSRAQAIAKISEEEFEQTLAEHREEQQAVTGRTMEKLARGIGMGFNNRGDIEYYTPLEYTDAARRVFGGQIDLDPASCFEANSKFVKATKFFTKEQDGLSQEWAGNVWCNPPYGGGAQAFCERALLEYQAGKISAAIFLLNGHSNGSSWFVPLWDFPLCFTSKRIRFHVPQGAPDADAGPTANSVIVYIGANENKFRDEFKALGFVVRRY